ncbi:MAG: phosphoadenylyl-sulfate reductase [Pseudomonadota bacterium]
MPYSAIAISKPETVEERLVRMNEELRGASAQTILRASILREWQDEITYVSSFGAESAVMLALIADVDPDLPIVFLETGMHFPQTLDYKDELIERLGLGNVREIKPDEIERERVDQKNTLWKTDPDACCELRKVRPLEPALEGFGAWVTGRKRFHGGARLSLPVFEFAAGRFKVNPMASWTQEDVQAYFRHRKLPRHPLVDQGFPSIGCWPCTQATDDPNDIRSGRWAGQDKSECGLHVDKADRPRVF